MSCFSLYHFHVLRQMSPEPDLTDSILLFILIKEECSCFPLSLRFLHPPHEGALCKVVINFLFVCQQTCGVWHPVVLVMELGSPLLPSPVRALPVLSPQEAVSCGVDHRLSSGLKSAYPAFTWDAVGGEKTPSLGYHHLSLGLAPIP